LYASLNSEQHTDILQFGYIHEEQIHVGYTASEGRRVGGIDTVHVLQCFIGLRNRQAERLRDRKSNGWRYVWLV